MSERSRELTVSGLARVEGEGALRITVARRPGDDAPS